MFRFDASITLRPVDSQCLNSQSLIWLHYDCVESRSGHEHLAVKAGETSQAGGGRRLGDSCTLRRQGCWGTVHIVAQPRLLTLRYIMFRNFGDNIRLFPLTFFYCLCKPSSVKTIRIVTSIKGWYFHLNRCLFRMNWVIWLIIWFKFISLRGCQTSSL